MITRPFLRLHAGQQRLEWIAAREMEFRKVWMSSASAASIRFDGYAGIVKGG